MGEFLFKQLIALTFILCFINLVSSECLCGAKGIDECSCNCEITRPVPLTKINVQKRPVDDVQYIVKEVVSTVPESTYYHHSGNTCSCGHSHLPSQEIIEKEEHKPKFLSLSSLFRKAEKKHVPEVQYDVKQFVSTVPEPTAFHPVGDTCSCGHQIVRPAVPPRSCQCTSQTTGTSKTYSSPIAYSGFSQNIARVPEAYQVANSKAHTIYEYKTHQTKPISRAQVPADVVSISLARQLSRIQADISENDLNYGPRNKPIDGAKVVQTVNIPEENLWSHRLGVPVIALKKNPFAKRPSKNSFDLEKLDRQEVVVEQAQPNYVTYRELGYDVENGLNREFVSGRNAATVSSHHRPPCVNSPAPSDFGDCGFRPGHIEFGPEQIVDSTFYLNQKGKAGLLPKHS